MNAFDPSASFGPTSRYAAVPTTTHLTADGREVTHLTRRVVPPAETLAVIREHIVHAGDRLDNVTAQHLGDAEQFWQVADANAAFDPGALTTLPGRRLRIALPQGVPVNPPF